MCSLQQRLFSCAERAVAAEGVAIHGHPAMNDGDHTDRYVTKGEKTYKLQFKFTNGNHAHSLNCFTKTSSKCSSKSGKTCIPYEMGVNDFYIFSVGSVTPTMLFLPESVLVKEGVIRTSTQPGKSHLPAHAHFTAFEYHHKHVTTVTSFLRSL
jgi:hypothetical protein